MADALKERLLPEGYFAEEHVHLGARLEIDVSTYEESAGTSPREGGIATLPVRVWNPPLAPLTIPVAIPDTFEILVFEAEGGAQLVAAIELVSPSNKDRASHRRAFALKCASYLCQGISLILVDIVTSRRANLHNEVMQLLEQDRRRPWRKLSYMLSHTGQSCGMGPNRSTCGRCPWHWGSRCRRCLWR